jgi:hypothetical protein
MSVVEVEQDKMLQPQAVASTTSPISPTTAGSIDTANVSQVLKQNFLVRTAAAAGIECAKLSVSLIRSLTYQQRWTKLL